MYKVYMEAVLLKQLLRHLAKLASEQWYDGSNQKQKKFLILDKVLKGLLRDPRYSSLPVPVPFRPDRDLPYQKDGHDLLYQKDGQAFMNTLLLLPPLPRDTHLIPFLHIRFEKRDGFWCCRFHVLLLTTKKAPNRPKGNIQGFSIRFESPEVHCAPQGTSSNASPGTHDFYHAQLSRRALLDFGKGSRQKLDLGSPGWLPERQPSFLLEANDPIQLFLHVLIALYGYTEFLRIVNGLDKGQRDLLQNFCQGHSFFSRIQGGGT